MIRTEFLAVPYYYLEIAFSRLFRFENVLY